MFQKGDDDIKNNYLLKISLYNTENSPKLVTKHPS